MTNNIGKGLVLLHTVFSIGAMTWAIALVLQGKDFGWLEPASEVVEYNKDGSEKTSWRRASELDKSQAALVMAAHYRDLAYLEVKPSIDAMLETEPYLAANHLQFVAKQKELRQAEGKLEIKRLKDAGLVVPTPLSPPEFGAVVDMVDKSLRTYEQESKQLRDDKAKIGEEIRGIQTKTKEITAQLTGTDEKNKYVQPGLYQLVDLEYQAQVQIKIETEQIKPQWSKAIEQAKLFRIRYDDLQSTMQRLEAPALKSNKK
jgi:DNA-binding XRE family transcriptional regulator